MRMIKIVDVYDGKTIEIERKHDAEHCPNPHECTGEHYHTSNCRCADCMALDDEIYDE